MVNFGEFLQAEVERQEASTRVFFVDCALKERLYGRPRAAQEARVDAVRPGVRGVFLSPFPIV